MTSAKAGDGFACRPIFPFREIHSHGSMREQGRVIHGWSLTLYGRLWQKTWVDLGKASRVAPFNLFGYSTSKYILWKAWECRIRSLLFGFSCGVAKPRRILAGEHHPETRRCKQYVHGLNLIGLERRDRA